MSLSFQIPVAALNEHQRRIELLSENIANLNTPGFKGKRMTFVETLGTVAGVSQFEFKQGSISYTGKATDLAIKGNSFFVLNNGDKNVYTRAGAFEINEKGELVNVDGFKIQGWMRDISDPTAKLSNTLQDIIIDSNLVMPANATQHAWLSGNLNAGLESVNEVWETEDAFTTKAVLASSGIITPLTITGDTNDQFIIEITNQLGDSISEELTLTAGTYNDVDSIVTEVNAQIAANSNLDGRVEAVNSNGTLKLRATDELTGTTLTLQDGTNTVIADLGYSDGATSTSGTVATAATELNDLLQVTSDLAANDEFTISGKDADGNSLDANFTYGTASNGTTLGDLIDTINALYSDVSTAKLQDGKIVLTDDVAGDSSTQISISGVTGNTGVIDLPSFANAKEGYTVKVNSSIEVFDSLGKSHDITITFTKSENRGEWSWSASASEGESILSGGSGKVFFDSSGNLVSFSYDGGVDSLKVDPMNGGNDIDFAIHADSDEGFVGLTQYNSVSSVHVREQDGIASGSLDGFKIDQDGSIIASFTNGEESRVAQIAVAEFSNPSGLKKIGGSNFTPTEDSGIASIGKASGQGSEIKAESLEISTVDLADQFTKLIEAQNSYQAAAKVINTFEQVAALASNLKR